MKMLQDIKTNYHYSILKYLPVFLKKKLSFYFRYLKKHKLTDEGFSLFFIIVSQMTFPKLVTDCKWAPRLLNDSTESRKMQFIPLVPPIYKHTLRLLTVHVCETI